MDRRELPRARPGYALPREYYTDPAVFELDLERLLMRHWFCAGHLSSLANTGALLRIAFSNPTSVSGLFSRLIVTTGPLTFSKRESFTQSSSGYPSSISIC